MRFRPVLLLLILPGALALATGAAAATDPATIQGFLFSTVLANLAFAVAVVLLGVFGLYAYASLARFAPYHTWIYLYLVSLAGVVWALFLMNNGGSLSDTVFLLTTVIGINLIVHALRFDRIEITSPRKQEEPVPSLFEV
jgi:hypothetical protein